MKRGMSRACRAELRKTFGVNEYRPGQKAAAACLLSGRDLLCILPTGAGKSLCWQLPAVVHAGLTVVVSPLIALMHDQVEGLRRRGIPAAAINSLMSPEERRAAEKQIRGGSVRILFVAPERLETAAFLDLCRDCPPWLIVVDEAHCVVQWGGDFRPAYSRIGEFIRWLKVRPVICAMTATADERMQRQITLSLGMAFHKRVMLPVLKENLIYSLRPTLGRTQEILRLAQENACRTVVFCRSRARTEQLAETLRRAGFSAEHYHAGLNREARESVQARFRSGRTLILAATTAFGMGIDIPDIRRIIHDRLPGSVIDLVQQSGRAGRDGRMAECIVLLSPEEFISSWKVLSGMYGAARWRPVERFRLMQREWLPIKRLMQVLMASRCIPAGIAASFGQRTRPCGRCSACLCGPLAKHPPELPRMDEGTLRRWLLLWLRELLAKQRGVHPEWVIPRQELLRCAETLEAPPAEDAAARQAFQRLMYALRGTDRQPAYPQEKPE